MADVLKLYGHVVVWMKHYAAVFSYQYTHVENELGSAPIIGHFKVSNIECNSQGPILNSISL